MSERRTLCDNLDEYRIRWEERVPNAPKLPTPSYRTAATAVAVGRTRATAESRGVWP